MESMGRPLGRGRAGFKDRNVCSEELDLRVPRAPVGAGDGETMTESRTALADSMDWPLASTSRAVEPLTLDERLGGAGAVRIASADVAARGELSAASGYVRGAGTGPPLATGKAGWAAGDSGLVLRPCRGRLGTAELGTLWLEMRG